MMFVKAAHFLHINKVLKLTSKISVIRVEESLIGITKMK